MTRVREWTVVLRGDWYLPHLINMLDEYRGNAEQRLCADEMVAQIRSQILTANGVGHETTRPLVVIDPEDREQVERLVTAYAKQRRLINGEDVTRTDDMQAALREFVNPTPPKPEEPTGLGAVVACENGVKVIRTDDPEFPWVDAARPGENSYHWTQCGGLPESPVKVLSEGIPA